MNLERIFEMVKNDLAQDKLNLEEELEQTINSNLGTEIKVKTIKELLFKLANVETTMVKFNSMIDNNTKN